MNIRVDTVASTEPDETKSASDYESRKALLIAIVILTGLMAFAFAKPFGYEDELKQILLMQ